jgi:hypothetical protein
MTANKSGLDYLLKRKTPKMKKILSEARLRKLAGLSEADTVDMYKSGREKKKRARHAAEKDFFGSEVDPLVTTDVPVAPSADPKATQPLSPAQLQKIQQDVPAESRRPVALQLYRDMIEPEYSEEDLEIIVHNDEDAEDALGQLIGWFHPAFHDRRGRPIYDNPSRLGVKVAQEFKKEGLNIIDDAEEFVGRLEKYLYDETKAEFAQNIADRKPARNVKAGRSATPGTPEYEYLQNLFKKIDAEQEFGSAPTGKMKR